jgi:hypothetical protein
VFAAATTFGVDMGGGTALCDDSPLESVVVGGEEFEEDEAESDHAPILTEVERNVKGSRKRDGVRDWTPSLIGPRLNLDGVERKGGSVGSPLFGWWLEVGKRVIGDEGVEGVEGVVVEGEEGGRDGMGEKDGGVDRGESGEL